MNNRLTIIESDSTNPYKNLALENWLLDHVAEDEVILYLWQNQHTVVVGKNQNAWKECNISTLEADGGHLARPLGDINGRLIARPHKGVHDAQEMAADGLLSRMGVHQKQQLALICHIDHLSVPYFTVCPGKMQ